jgi:flagellar hook-associated protein 1 FlgK
MASDLLNIGKTGLLAAQVGMSTTGHNISNANVTGYSRQTVVQSNVVGQQVGYGFTGNGTEVSEVKRVYDNFLATQVRSAQSTTSQLDAYSAQISQIDNMMADSTAGLSPSMQDFFDAVQDVSANPSLTASRQSFVSSADALATRFQSLSARLSDIADGVNSDITTTVGEINSYASQIAELNASISNLATSPSNQPNDLLDQRDQMVNELNKLVKATVTVADNNTITVSIGSGQPLVVGNKSYELAATPSLTDPTRMEVGYVTGNKTTILPEDALTGGSLGGVLAFRSESLDQIQNGLGRVAIGLAYAFNEQNKLGQDQNGDMGGDIFAVSTPQVTASSKNNATSTTSITASISDPSALTDSNYTMKFDGTNFVVTRESDGTKTTINPYPQTGAQTIDGVDYVVTGSAANGDNFSIKPTANGAADFKLEISDGAKLAAATPITTGAASSNVGSAKVSAGTVDSDYLTAGNALTSAVTLTYDKTAGTLSGFPSTQDVTVTADGVDTVYPAGTASIPYTDGANISFGGVNLEISGTPGDQDTFTVGPNTSGVGDSRNMVLLAALQTSNILDGGKTTLQGSYAQTVAFVGNKTRETQINGAASQTLLDQTTAAQSSISGVNLDEEAANLLRYQQAYQAAGKVMQIASTLFDTLLSLGN